MSSSLPSPPAFGTPLPVMAEASVLRFLARRRSVSAMSLTAPAPTPEQQADLLRLASRVPDHGKLTPWRFVLLEGEAKSAFAARLEQIAMGRGDPVLAAKLGKLKTPPLAIAVVCSPKPSAIPEWEQILSAGAVCTNLLYGALAMGFGANWITDWYSYDPEATAVLGLAPEERVAGFLMIGSAKEPPLERERADVHPLVRHWSG